MTTSTKALVLSGIADAQSAVSFFDGVSPSGSTATDALGLLNGHVGGRI